MSNNNYYSRLSPFSKDFDALRLVDKSASSLFDGYTLTKTAPKDNLLTRRSVELPQQAVAWCPHNYWFIGDIHSNFDEYKKLLASIRKYDSDAITIQVGDLDLDSPKQIDFLGERDFFIQGNHDTLAACEKHPQFMGRFGYKHGVFFLGGAASSKFGYENEELSLKELNEAIDLYDEMRPEIVVTHDCPQIIREELFFKKDTSRTSDALQEMWDIQSPNVWAFGHHHWSTNEIIDGTQFICVGACKAQKIQLSWTIHQEKYQSPSQPIQATAGKVIGRFLNSLNPFSK